MSRVFSARALRSWLMGATSTALALAVVTVSLAVVVHAFGTPRAYAATPDPVLVAAGDIACDPNDPNYNNGNGKNGSCQEQATANLVAGIAPQYLLPVGDTQYDNSASQGTQPPLSYYQTSYDGSWGKLASTQGGPVPNQNIHPIAGNHEYGDVNDSGQPPLSNASNYFSNFGPSGLNELPSGVTSPSNDWYSFNIPVNGGAWHVVSLDSECGAVGGCGQGSPEETFLKNDLAANPGVCTIVQWHEPRWSVGPFGNVSDYAAFWDDAVAAHVVMVLGGHDHDYEHFGPMDANGNPVTTGTSEFIVGTGGESIDSQSGSSSALLASDFKDFGVLKLTLHSTGADYAFQTVASGTQDSGTVPCSSTPPTTTITGVSPSLGLTAGGTSVTITGVSFTGATAVKFGSTPAAGFTVNSDTSITAASPAQAAGPVDVSVTAPAGTSTKSGADEFTYETVTNLVWTKETPATIPAARSVSGMTLDQNGDVIMLGGDAGNAHAIGDFWKYTEPSGTPTWTQMTPAHTPWGLVGASGLADAQMRLDPVSKNVVAFGGTAYSGNFNSTWSWNGTDWSLLSPVHAPAKRSEYGMDYDPSTGHIMVMGGFPNGTFSNMYSDTWTWSGTDWIKQTPVHSPGPRAGQVMVRDPSRGIVVLFGGHNGPNTSPYATILADTWTWNGSDWTEQSPAHVPAPREYSQAYYDPNLQMVVMCGGVDNSRSFTDCWGWNGSDWVKIPQDTLSEINSGATFVYSSKLSKTITFGGWPSVGNSTSNETWAFMASAPAPGLNPAQYSNGGIAGSSPQGLDFNLAPVDAGNALTAVIAVHKPSGATATITPPPGWTTVATGGTGSSPWVGVYEDDTPTTGTSSVTFTCSIDSGSVIAGGVVTEFRGVPMSGSGDGTVIYGSGSGQTASPTGATPAGSGELALVAFATDSTNAGSGLTTSTAPSGWALAGDQADSLNTDGIAAWAYWKTGTASAPSASLSWTNTGGSVPYTTAITSLASPTAQPAVLPVPAASTAAISSTDVVVVGRSPASGLWYQQSSSGVFGGWQSVATSDVASQPVAVVSGTNLYVFFRATNNELHYFVRAGSTWGTEQNLGGVISGNPAAALDGNGAIIVVALNSAGNVFADRLPSGGSWTGFTSLAGVLSGRVTLGSLSGNVYLLGVNGAGLGWTREWTAGSTNAWGSWTPLGGVFEAGTTLSGAPYGSTLHVQGVNGQGILFEATGSGTTWSGWTALNGVLAATPSLAATTSSLFVFDTNPAGVLWYQQNTTSWLGWTSLAGFLETGPVSAAAGANAFVFGLNNAGNLWYREWNGTAFGAWTDLGGILATA